MSIPRPIERRDPIDGAIDRARDSIDRAIDRSTHIPESRFGSRRRPTLPSIDPSNVEIRSMVPSIDRSRHRSRHRSNAASFEIRTQKQSARDGGDCLTNHDSDVGSTHWMIFGLRWRSAHADARADERRHRVARTRGETRGASDSIFDSTRRAADASSARDARARERDARLRRSIVEI